jgi:transketolase
VVFAYGPVLLDQALLAAERLAGEGIGVRVINMPWLNFMDAAWLSEVVGGRRTICCIDDHSPTGGLAHHLLPAVHRSVGKGARTFVSLGVGSIPACGTAAEALHAHGLDADSIASRLRETIA